QPDPLNPDATPPLDDQGLPVPNCNLGEGLSKPIIEATMYNFQGAMEISKRTLTQDDIDGACHGYPIALDPQICAPTSINVQSGGSAAPDQDPSLVGAAAAALVVALRLLGTARRRRI